LRTAQKPTVLITCGGFASPDSASSVIQLEKFLWKSFDFLFHTLDDDAIILIGRISRKLLMVAKKKKFMGENLELGDGKKDLNGNCMKYFSGGSWR
jgi:hypothetical protein